ncbi:MAG: hypothetical protein LUG24_01940 [Clostridiales bacterium]|nr:hypothetical protein [Clostridiales bacterium]
MKGFFFWHICLSIVIFLPVHYKKYSREHQSGKLRPDYGRPDSVFAEKQGENH